MASKRFSMRHYLGFSTLRRRRRRMKRMMSLRMMTVRMMTAVITKPLAKVISSEGARLWLARLC